MDSIRITVFEGMMQEIRRLNIEKGWRADENTVGEYVALLHSEVSEVLEAFRNHHDFGSYYEVVPHSSPTIYKPVGVDSELADVLIRLLDMCDIWGINIYHAYIEKMEFNKTRPYQHGGRTLK